MTDENDETPILSQGTVALLDAWLRSQKALAPPAAAPPDVETLTRYLSGVLSADAAREVEWGIVTHPAACDLLIQVRACLDELQAIPWAEVAERAKSNDLTAQVAQAWLAIATERVSILTRAREWLRTHGWEVVRQQVAQGVAEAQAAWAAFTSFCQQMRAELTMPRLALERGLSWYSHAYAPDMAYEGMGEFAVPTVAEVTADGALRVMCIVYDMKRNPSTATAGKTAHLALRVSGEEWQVATAIVEGDRIEWNIPHLGAALGLPVGRLPLDRLHITIGEGEIALGEGMYPVPVFAEVIDAQGQPTAAPPVMIAFLSEPRWSNGQFTITVAIPAWTRAQYPDHTLRLDVFISEQSWQHLGAWRLSDWVDDERTLTVLCPGSPDVTIPFASAIRARLQAPAPV